MRTGVFQMPMAVYLAEEGVSQSALKRMSRSPAHLQAYLREKTPSTKDQIIGTATHTAVFEPELLEESLWVKPRNYQNKKAEWKKWNGNATECKDWLAAHVDRPILSEDDFDDVAGMSKAILAHPAANQCLLEGKAELSLFCEDPDTALQLKCRADWLSGNAIVDLKTTDDASLDGFARSIAKFGYDVQAAYNLDIAEFLSLGKIYFIFIVVEKTAPYAVAVYELDDESIQIGRSKYRRWLGEYARCREAGIWPGYSSNRQVITLPSWNKRVEETAMLLDCERPLQLEETGLI